jgi:hypothetical protein
VGHPLHGVGLLLKSDFFHSQKYEALLFLFLARRIPAKIKIEVLKCNKNRLTVLIQSYLRRRVRNVECYF